MIAGQKLTLLGSVDAGGSQPIRLQADPYPFDTFRDSQETEARVGNFTVDVRPRVNTRYRARVLGGRATSRSVTVYAEAKPRVAFRRRNGPVEVVGMARVPAYADPTLAPVFFYSRPKRQRHIVLLGTARPHRARGERLEAVLTVADPSAYTRAFVCVRRRWAKGMGKAGRYPFHCGAKTLSLNPRR